MTGVLSCISQILVISANLMKEYQQCFLTFLWRPDSFRIVFFSMQWTVSSTMELISMILYRLIVSTRSKINDVSAIATTDISSRSMAKKFTLLLTVIQYSFAMSKSTLLKIFDWRLLQLVQKRNKNWIFFFYCDFDRCYSSKKLVRISMHSA